MKKVLEKRKDIAFYIKLYPLPMHKDSARKAKAILCEKSLEKSLALLDDAFAHKTIPDPKCETNQVEENIKLAQKFGINGTPTMIFPDGSIVSGALDADALINQAVKK